MAPLVSVLIAAYNAEKYLGETIESVLASNYSNWELIIVDDKSLDNTLQIARDYEKLDKRIQVYVNDINLGDYPNRNKTASYAKGKYLKYLDNDDILYKYSLDYMVEAMEKFPEAGLGLGFLIVDDIKPYPIYYTPLETYRAVFLQTGFLGYGPSAAIIKRESFEKKGGFSGRPFLGDQELWLQLAFEFPVIKLQPALIWYRLHPEQESLRERKELKNENIRYHLIIEVLNKAKLFFSEDEFEYALKKLKRNHARFILRNIIVNKRIKEGFIVWKNSGLTFIELLEGFRPYLN